MNRELKQHINILEKSNDEHKRVSRKREKEFDHVRNEYEQNAKDASVLNQKVPSLTFAFVQSRTFFYCSSIVHETRCRIECTSRGKCNIE